jgi:N-acetylneuraminic acid mutarotase
MKIKLALWILSVLLGGMTYLAGAQVTLDSRLAGPSRAEGAASVAGRHSLPYELTFAERVAYQRAIEEVYWRHRIWPKENREAKPALAEVMPETALRAKVEDYLRKSQALAEYRQRPLSGEQLQAEMERMARQTRQPERLRELWAALGNDPYVIAECLVRPALAYRLLRSWHGRNERYPRASTKALTKGWAEVRGRLADAADSPRAGYRLPVITTGSSGCVDDTWAAPPDIRYPNPRERHTAVWTGAEMIVWGGTGSRGEPLNTGGRYDPATDTWASPSTDTVSAPSARYSYTAVWTGKEMIVWGGAPSLVNTGGRYDPATNTWVATNTAGAPSGRADHTAVWTGKEMIVWGGNYGLVSLNTGGRYDPETDTWATISLDRAPSPRRYHTAVWTDKEMIVWGGTTGDSTGGRYDPKTDTWMATNMTNAPVARIGHTAVWTGKEMIVWGGGAYPLNTGSRYDPETDTWMATNTTGAAAARQWHTAVWTGAEMIVWGGNYDGTRTGHLNTGAGTIRRPTPGRPPA